MARRFEVVALQNARIAAAARVHHFDDVSPVPFLCCCDDEDCREVVALTLARYDRAREQRLYAVAEGHRFPGAERVDAVDGVELYRADAGADTAPGSRG